MAPRAIPDRCLYPGMRRLRAIQIPAMAIAMCSCSTTAIVFSTNFFGAVPNSNGSWNAASAAIWDLLSDGNTQRPWTWTSADAAVCRFFPAWCVMTKWPRAGSARHSRHPAGQPGCGGASRHALGGQLHQRERAPMGMRMRLKANYNISGFSFSSAGHPFGHEKVRPDHGR